MSKINGIAPKPGPKMIVIRIDPERQFVMGMETRRRADMMNRLLNVKRDQVAARSLTDHKVPGVAVLIKLCIACVNGVEPGSTKEWSLPPPEGEEVTKFAGIAYLFGSANGGVCSPPVGVDWVRENIVWHEPEAPAQ